MMQAYVAYRGTWERRFRSPWGRALIAAALMVSLVLDGIFLAVDRLHSPAADRLEHPADPVTDAQSRNQVVEPAQQIVTVARLQNPTAGYLLMSCKTMMTPVSGRGLPELHAARRGACRELFPQRRGDDGGPRLV